MTHPSPDELKRFATGDLSQDRFEEIARHIECCDECATVLESTGAFPNLIRDEPSSAVQTPSQPIMGSTVGPYKLLQKLGEGGMGVVYMAEQEKPVRRMVALKIIKPGMDSSQVIARFESERQALAMMDHHHIAKVLDAGTTDAGRPYFAMELVRGVPITDYCDRNKLRPQERLEMFVAICHAIQHAHQKGIIHRDIKPSNVLVTLYDGKPVPKVIDFGIAKATHQKLTDRTMFTGIGQIVGTLEYMSPEQAEMNQLDIDTRSDVYSLGVMLYELLTGSTPITKKQLRKVGLEEMLRTIRETEPPKPSTRLSDSADVLPSISSVRKTEPAKLSKFVRGDLDWIVMKALEKDRTRRYETANGLAADVQRFLSDEAVEACPPSAGYRFRKFARRNKTALATGATIAAILLAATFVSSGLAVWAMRAARLASANEARAQAAAAAEQRQRSLAQSNAERAAREATKSKAVASFLKEMLNGVGPSVALGRDTAMLKEILEKTLNRLETDLAEQPEVQAELRSTIGHVFSQLGQHEDAEEQHREALRLYRGIHGRAHVQIAAELHHVGNALAKQIRYSQGMDQLQAGLEMRRSLLGDNHVDVARSLYSIAELKSESWQNRNKTYPRLDSYEGTVASYYDALANYQASESDHDLEAAELMLKLAHFIGISTNRLAPGAEEERRNAEISALMGQTLDLLRKRTGTAYRIIEARAMALRAGVYASQQLPEQALDTVKQAVQLLESIPEGRVELVEILNSLAYRHRRLADFTGAKRVHRRRLSEALNLYGPDSPRVEGIRRQFAHFLYEDGNESGDYEEAIEMMRRLADSRHVSEDVRSSCMWALAMYLTFDGTDPRNAKEAASLVEQAWQIQQRVRGKENVLWMGESLCNQLCMAGEIQKAVAVQNEIRLCESELWHLASILNTMAGDHGRNQRLFEDALAAISRKDDGASRNYAAATAILLDANASLKYQQHAIVLAERAFETATERFRPKAAVTLALARYRQGRHAEADRLSSEAIAADLEERCRPLATVISAMSRLQQQGRLSEAHERIDELGLFSILPTELPQCFHYSENHTSYDQHHYPLAALHLQTELRALDSTLEVKSLSLDDRISLGLARQARHVARHPGDVWSARHLAYFYAWFGRDDEHLALCRQIVDKALKSDDIREKFHAAVQTLCRPVDEVVLVERAKELAGQTVASVNAENLTINNAQHLVDYQLAYALAEIRLGNIEQARAWLGKAEPIVGLHNRGKWFALCAICHSRLGDVEQARDALANARTMIFLPTDRQDLTLQLFKFKSKWNQSTDHDESMKQYLEWLLLDEAQSILPQPS